MKKIKSILLATCITALLASSLFAAENEGFFKRLWHRWFPPKAESVKEVPAKAVPEPLKIPPAPQVAEVAGEKAARQVEAARRRVTQMTKGELIEDIMETLDSEDEVLDYVPELKKTRDPSGKEFYTYGSAPLEDLEKGLLEKIWARVHQTATKIRTERIQDQLETIRQIENLRRATTPPPQPPPQPPRVPPSPPRIPPQPPEQTRR
ncbi:MAG: hypothetical protein JW919_05845 [Candidatus Omnitrophica bacterium]|nr:hypothetical protein [Candidatus Omnitrophota bacterium]